MYDDPKDIRDRPVTVRFREETYEMIKALARDSGQQPAALARELVIDGIERLLREQIAARRPAVEAAKEHLKIAAPARQAHARRADGTTRYLHRVAGGAR
jgi:hypothetical protein